MDSGLLLQWPSLTCWVVDWGEDLADGLWPATPVSSYCLSKRELLPWGLSHDWLKSECKITRVVKPLGRIKGTLWGMKSWLSCPSFSPPWECL